MFCTDMMPRSTNAALEQRECVLDGIRVGVPDHIDSLRVIDGLVLSGLHTRSFDSPRIGRVIIRKNHFGIFADILADVLGERLGFHIFGMEQSKFAIALPNSDDDFFVSPRPDPWPCLL